MAQPQPVWATIDDLHRERGKAELIGGRIVRYMPTGFKPGRVGGRIFRKLDEHCDQSGRGAATPDNVGFAVPVLRSGRESFSPDAAYYAGELPENPMRFISGPPTLAVEVRSENDYSPAAEAAMAAKRADYFEAGTLVVWDVDPLAEVIRVFRGPDPLPSAVYGRGEEAEAGPAVPGWRVPVDWIFS